MHTSLRPLFVVLSLIIAPASLLIPYSRQLTFEDRVRAQEAIERAYYSRLIGATRSFEEAVPQELLEKKVRTYLRQSVALERIWHEPVTAQGLRAELDRMVLRTQDARLLQEVFKALGDDALLIQECFARQVLVDQKSRASFAYDRRIHEKTRSIAARLRDQLLDGQLDASQPHPNR